MPREPLVIVCIRIATASPVEIVPGAVRRRCAMCGEQVWLSPSSKREEAAGGEVRCLDCVGTEVAAHVEVTDEQLAEVQAALGPEVTRESLARSMQSFLAHRSKVN